MATAAEEALKLLTDFNSSDVQSLAMQGQMQAAQLSLLESQDTQRRTSQSQSAASLKLQERDANDFAAAKVMVESAARKLGLNSEQQYLSRISGEFDAVLDSQLQDQEGKARDDDSRRRATLARELLRQDNELFRQANPDQNIVDYTSIAPDRVKDLASEDGFGGFIAKAATTAAAGIPGLGAIAAGALGAEGVAQTLGGAARTISDLAPTDLGSSAASQQGASIQARVEAGELTLGQGASELAKLALTDGDFAGDLLGTTLGSAVGGGAVGGVARAGARAAGVSGLTSTVGRGAAQALPAAGVGIGAGVDETITTPQAQVLAGTIGASSLLGGLTAGLGGSVAETALGNVARRLPGAGRIPGVTAPTTGARTVGGALTERTTGQIAGRAAGSAIPSAAGEAAQEFVESGGESLAQSAQGGFEGIDDSAIRSAGIAGTLAAPLGAGIGGPLGAASSVSDSRATNAATQAQVASNRAAINAQNPRLQPGFAEGAERAAGIDQAAAEQETAIAARQSELNATRTEAVGVEIPFTENTPRNQRGQKTPEVATLANSLDTNPALDNDAFEADLVAVQADPISLRALYRNQLQATPGVLQDFNEDAFVAAITAIPDSLTIPESRQAVDQAYADAQNNPQAQQRSDQAAANFIQGVESTPVEEQAAQPNLISNLIAEQAARIANSQASATEKALALSAAIKADLPDITDTQVAQALTPLIEARAVGSAPVTVDDVVASLANAVLPADPVPGISTDIGATEAGSLDPQFTASIAQELSQPKTSIAKALALAGLLRTANPGLPDNQIPLIAETLIEQAAEKGAPLEPSEIFKTMQQVAPGIDFSTTTGQQVGGTELSANEATTFNEDPDPTPPATAAPVPEAPALTEPTEAIAANQVFEEEQLAARFQADFDKLSSEVGNDNLDLKAFREGGKLLDSEGVTGFKPKTLRTLAQRARAAKAKLAAGETLTATEKGQVVNGLDKYRRAVARGKPEAADAATSNDSYGEKAGEHLEGLPKTVLADGQEKVFTGLKSAEDAAKAHMASQGRPYTPIRKYLPVDTERAKRIADAYEAMEHTPNDPATAASYRAMIDETYAQYQTMLDQGVVVEFNQGSDPYGNPRNAILDVVENNHMYVFSTKEGFGTDAVFDPTDSPMMEVSPFKFGNQEAWANDVFRAVHDYFGHIKNGLGFRARGEDNAWRSHATMYSAAARPAATTETRGQNSWVNFGPFAEANQTASGAETRIADQKVGLLPDWVMEDAEMDFSTDTPTYREGSQTDTPEFKAFFKDSKVVDANGDPLVVYAGVSNTDLLIEGSSEASVGRFNTRKSGAFFSDQFDIAESYIGENDTTSFDDEGSVQAVYLSFQNPLIVDAKGAVFSDLADPAAPLNRDFAIEGALLAKPSADPVLSQLLQQQASLGLGRDSSKLYIGDVKAVAQSIGYDGAIIRNVEDSGGTQTQYIAFEPTQIKSATDNSGSFNPKSPNIRAARSAQPVSGIPANRPSARGLLPEGASEQERQFSLEETQAVVARIVSQWKGRPRIIVVNSNSDLPANLQVKGLVDGITHGATAYIVADKATSEAHIADTLLEETFHKGIQKSLGGNYDPVLDKVFKSRGVEGILKLVSDYEGRSDFTQSYRAVISAAQRGDVEAQRELVDEALAQVALSQKLPSGIKAALKRIVAQIKRAVAKVYPALLEQYSDNDLHLLIREANTAGRTDGEFSGPQRVRAKAGLAPGEYLGTDPSGETRVYKAGQTGSTPTNVPLKDQFLDRADGAKALLTETRSTGLGKKIYRSDAYQGLVKRIANSRTAAARVEQELDFATPEQAVSLFDEIAAQEDVPDLFKALMRRATNETRKRALLAINSLLTTYSSRGSYLAKKDLKVNSDGDTLFTVMQRFSEAKGAVQDAEGLNDKEANQVIGLYANALHASERNDIAWIKGVELSDSDAIATRTEIIKNIGLNKATPADMDTLRQLAQDFGTTPREDFVGSGLSDAEASQMLSNINADPVKGPLYREAVAKLRELQEASNEIKKQTGSFSTALQSTIDLYGWKNYVPLKGRGLDPDEELGDTFIAFHGDNVFSTTFRSFEGRESLAEDVVGNVYRNAISSVEQNAAQEFIESVAIHAQGAATSDTYSGLFEQDGEGGKLLEGSLKEYDINSPAFKSLVSTKDASNLILYNKDNRNNPDNQTALVVTLNNPKGVDAILGAKSNMAEQVDNLLRKASVGGKTIHDVTQVTSSLKTFRNLPFIPFDALRNILTVGYVAATEGGLTGFQSYLNQFSEPGTNYASDIYKFVGLYTNNQFAEIDAEVAAKPGGVMAELNEFYRLGGPVNFLSAIRERAPGSLEAIGEETRVSGGGIAGASQSGLRKLDNIFTKLNMSADTLSRFAYYKSLKAQGVPPEVAAARAKNTANFENRGTWSGPLGGLFEFFRATASGSTALINTTLTGEYGPQTAAAAFGSGAMLYTVMSMFAGTDDNDEDRMAQVNGALFNNNLVFQYGDKPSDRLQVGLGFGPIAAAVSSGIHAARLGLGHANINSTLDNISSAIVNQYKVVPASSISPLDTLNFVSSSITPSIIKPWAEVSRNMTSLGIPVRSDYAGADSGDLTGSFAGRYSSEQEMYEQVTQGLRNSGFANINPDDFRHIVRSYGGTLAYLAESVFENVQAVTSEDFAYNKKQGMYVARQFFGSTYSQKPADFYEHYKRVEDLDNQAKKFESAGNDEAAEAIRTSEVYSNNIDLYKQAKKDLNAINDEYKPTFRLDSTTTAQKRAAESSRNELRERVFNFYLENVQ